MHDAGRYRCNAAECLLAAQKGLPYYRELHLSLADTWLLLARQDEAMDSLLSIWDVAKPVSFDGLAA